MVNYNWQEETDTNSDPLSLWTDTTCLLKCCGTSRGLCTESLIKCRSIWIAKIPVTIEEGGRNVHWIRTQNVHQVYISWYSVNWSRAELFGFPLYFTKDWTEIFFTEECTVCLAHTHTQNRVHHQERVRKEFNKRIGQAALDRHRAVWKQPLQLTLSA